MINAATELPKSIIQLNVLFFENVELESKLERQVDDLNSKLEKAMGSTYERCGLKISSEGYHRIISDYQKRVEKVAREALSVPGGPFEPDISLRPSSYDLLPYSAEAEQREQALQKLSPATYWRVVAATVDPSAQQEKAARDSAIVLGRFVGLLSGDRWGQGLTRNDDFVAPKTVKGALEFELVGAYVHDEFGGRRRLSVSEHAVEVSDAIQYALDATGHDGDPVGTLLRKALLHMSGRDWMFVPRERVEVGGGAWIVTFVKGSKLYLPQDVAQAINLFVSEQLADVLMAEAA